MTIEEYLAGLKPNQVLVTATLNKIGTNEDGTDLNELVYETKPLNFKYITHDEALKIAILEDLDYVEPNEATL